MWRRKSVPAYLGEELDPVVHGRELWTHGVTLGVTLGLICRGNVRVSADLAVTLPLPCPILTEMFFQERAESFGPLVERVFQCAEADGRGAGMSALSLNKR